jgi:diguanylate cyclase (GGDEF)-like protein
MRFRTTVTPALRGRRALLAILALIFAIAFVLALAPWGGPSTDVARVNPTTVADSVLHSQLRPSDVRNAVPPGRERQLDRLFRSQVLIDGVEAAFIRNSAGRITYATGQPGPQLVTVSAALTSRSGERAGTLELAETPLPGGGRGPLPFILLATIGGLALLLLSGTLSRPAPIILRHDHTERLEDMERRAFHDTLTGLPNRELLHQRVAQAIDGVGPEGGTVAVMLMDLDRFKEINDTFGHQCGDQLLREVAAHLREAVRSQDTVARLGGDEFAILCAPVAGPLGAVALAERALEEVQRSHMVAGVEVDVDASIGIALYPRHGETVDELLRCADIAMYAAKASGAPTVFARELDNHSVARLTLASQLRRAIAQSELAVYFQPKADFETGAITSAEALVRWEHPELGLLPPDEFIPLAEQTGLIRPLTTYVLDGALEQCNAWRRQGLNIAVAVNVTGRDLLDQRFAEEVKDLLRKWEVMPTRLELEITENTVLTDPVRARTVLMTLHQLGVRLAIDDFGSGNSSLSYLKRLPIDVLKIDKSFVLAMHDSEDDAVIVRSTIDLGHNLGLKVVAEGVSSVDAWDRLRGLGCDVAQGYYLSKPVPGSAIAELVADEASSPRTGGGPTDTARVSVLRASPPRTGAPQPSPASGRPTAPSVATPQVLG